MTAARLWFGAVALLAAAPLAAETLYVTDQVTVPIRGDVDPAAVVLKNVASGAALELLERRDALARVRDADGVEGWIDAAVLTTQPPAAAQLRTLRAELERTRSQLINAQTQLDKARAPSAAAAEVATLKTELATAREQLAAAQADLKRREEELAAVAAAQAAEAAEPDEPAEPAPQEFSLLWPGIAFAMLVLGFVGGIVWVRESIRRRMGGLYLRI